MSETLFPYYERELQFIRQMAQDFAKRYPAAAGRLLLESNRSADPHVERLIESFALLTARIQHKLDDEYPELTEALLSVLYPHFLAPIPAMATVQFQLDHSRGQNPQGFTIPLHSSLRTTPVQGLACRFRTCYPVRLWPIELKSARYQAPPFPPQYKPPPRTNSALRLRWNCSGKMKFEQLQLDKLRLYLHGPDHVVASLYELIFNHATQVVFQKPDDKPGARTAVFSPSEVLTQVGFGLDEGMLPYPKRSFPGYRLLTELFAFPSKFWYIDIGGWKQAAEMLQPGKELELVIYFNRHVTSIEEWLDEQTFQLGCAPVVNLFPQTAEPIPLNQKSFEYRVVPDVHHPLGMEVHSIEEVRSVDPVSNSISQYMPFYSFRHSKEGSEPQAFWHASRRDSLRANDKATEVYLSFVNLGFEPHLPAASTIVVHTTCSNRNLAQALRRAAADEVAFQLEGSAPISSVRCLKMPSTPLRPPLRRGAHWGLVSHLLLNHLSLNDEDEGLAALHEILRLYDFSDVDPGQRQQSEVNRQLIDGLTGLKSRFVVGRVPHSPNGFCRGVEVTLEFDEQKYVGTGVFLFASVLERFLGLHVTLNSFTQLVAKVKQREGILKKWPPRSGEIQLM